MMLRLALGWLALLVSGAALGIAALAALVTVVLSAGGVLTTPPGAWVVHVRPVPGLRVTLSVPGLVGFATSPIALRLLDGRTMSTRVGKVQLARDGDTLQAVCAPCRFDAPWLATQPVRIDRLQLRLARTSERTLAGELVGGDVKAQFTARLQPERIDVDWQLPPVEIGSVYRVLESVIPEAHLARIDGRIEARGGLRLPQRRARIELATDGFAVDGLGTERLAAGPVEFGCPDAGAMPRRRRVTPGEGRWISPAGSGALLAAAVLAAEDQRFHEHTGFDRAEIAQVLASVEEQGITRGASTITQQLARTLITGGERTGARKLRELLYAVEMERTLGKRAILALYLNTVHWGPGICGADAAARAYFAKRPGDLTPLEAAWLAAILPNPAQAHAQEYRAGTADHARAVRVLQQMRTLRRAERDHWAGQPLTLARAGPAAEGPARLVAAPEQSRHAATPGSLRPHGARDQ